MAATGEEKGLEKGDVWNVVDFQTDEKEWEDKTGTEKALTVLVMVLKIVLAFAILYLFIISLGLMANSFRILGGKSAGRAFRDSELFDNPLAGLVTGILVTVLVQSSSTSTSIIITMTAGDLIEVKNAIFMIMGANIGTSVTNTLVSLGSFGDKDEYRRAFAGATIHDCFNFLTVLTFLPIEAVTGFFRHMASAICDGMGVTDDEEKGAKTDFLKKITKPVGSRLLGIDKKLITAIAKEKDAEEVKKYEETSIIKHKQKDDNHIFMDTPMSDEVAGILMVCVSLGFLCICLMCLVKLLSTIFRGRAAIWFRKALNLEFESAPGVANYVLIVFGIGITILFQSSSVTTSTLTPLCGIGLVRLDKMFAFTVGANIGTTFTGLLGAMVSDKRKTALTVALAHVLFNVFGTLIWYPIPLLRNIPIGMAKINGNIAADLRVFPIVYIIFMFGLLPLLLMGLSIVSPWLCLFVGVPILLGLLALFALIGLRANRPEYLPAALKRDFGFLPESLRMAKTQADESSTQENTSKRKVASADLGKQNWQAAPAAWGAGWFVVLALLSVCFNAKWTDMKYAAWDKRNHYGISGWSACSYAFEKAMPWAPAVDGTNCNSTVLSSCGESILGDCQNADFSTTAGSNALYEKSWAGCRTDCLTSQWQDWCLKQQCGGSAHEQQCVNVTNAVQRPYSVTYMDAGKGNAWEAGERCRDTAFLCSGVEEDVKTAGDLGVAGLAFSAFGLITLVAYSMKQNLTTVLIASLASWIIASVLLLASWATFAGSLGKDAVCKVEAESLEGAVLAIGKFEDITNGGSYTYGFIIGSWLLSFVPISLIALRIKDVLARNAQISESENVISEISEPEESKAQISECEHKFEADV
jgi:sodium-dependent phosphate cotransporter